MVEKFHKELNALKKDVLKMGHLGRDMLVKSIDALKDEDVEIAEWVLKQKVKLEDLDDCLEERAFRLIALYQPMAKDLRIIACSLKMITYITRIGRYGKDIAKLVVDEFDDRPHIKKLVSIPYMAQIVQKMVDDALAAFEEENIDKIDDFDDRDDTVDELRYSIFRECLSYMMEDQKVITQCSHYIMVARYLERCADHACKMAEKIHYMVTGEHIEIDRTISKEHRSKTCNRKKTEG